MKVTVYSREAIEHIIAEGSFPNNTAVISFCDPELKHIDKDYSRVDYSAACDDVFYCEVDDLDLDYLPEKEYTYESFFPETPELAEYINKAFRDGKDIICQCEYGQSRSAGCAAAILEHFYRRGIDIFADYKYYPNQVVYHKVYDAIERQKRYYDNKYYFAANADVIQKHIEKLHLPEAILSDYQPENSHSVVDCKAEIEKHLLKQNQLYRTSEEIINALLKTNQPIYASFTVTKLFYLYFCWNSDGVGTYFRYGCEKIPVYIYFNRYRYNSLDYSYMRRHFGDNSIFKLGRRGHFHALSFFGKLSWDSQRNMIDAIPLIMTNMR